MSLPMKLLYPRKVVASGGPNPTDSFSLGIKATDINLAPTDAASFRLNLSQGDSNVTPTDAVSLNIKGLGDTNQAPTDGMSIKVRVWLSGTTMQSTNGVTNPANANGSNNGTMCTLTSAALGDTNPRTVSNVGSNIGAISFSSAIFRGWFRNTNTLVTSRCAVYATSSSALFSDITMFIDTGLASSNDFTSGNFTFDLVVAGVNTLAKLQSLQIRFDTGDAVAGVTPATLNVDAGAVDLTGVF